MAFVITRLCRDCVDTACVSVCPTDCIVEHRSKSGAGELPNQLFIDPAECIDCNMCAPECPWEAIFPEADVPEAFHDDIELNSLAANRERGFEFPSHASRSGRHRKRSRKIVRAGRERSRR